MSIVRARLPEKLAVWSILRPRHYDDRLATVLLAAAGQEIHGPEVSEIALEA